MIDNITEYIESGILELYVLGEVTPTEAEEVEQMAALYPVVRQELNAIQENLEQYALAHAVPAPPLAKSLFLATIDYMERLKNGEPVANIPLLSKTSRISDYAEWLDRPDLTLPPEEGDLHIKIIGSTPEVTTAIAWLIKEAPSEVHSHEYESFLIIEGTCTVTAGQDAFDLKPGDYYDVPLHTSHAIQVTSAIPCKVVVQRVAV